MQISPSCWKPSLFQIDIATGMRRCRRGMVSLLAGLMAVFFVPAVAAETPRGMHPLQYDRFQFSASAFYADLSGSYRLEGRGGLGVDISFEEDLGFSDRDALPALAFTWRFSDRSRLEYEFFKLDQNNSDTISRELEWGDNVFAIGARVDAGMEIDVHRLFYGYSFFKDAKSEVGAGIGLHYATLDAFLSGNATVNGNPVANARGEIDEWGILPNIGAFGNYALSDKWLLMGRVDWLSASIQDYSGSLWNTEFGVQYQAFRNVGIGLAYRYVFFEIEQQEGGPGDWHAEQRFAGPSLFITANF